MTKNDDWSMVRLLGLCTLKRGRTSSRGAMATILLLMTWPDHLSYGDAFGIRCSLPSRQLSAAQLQDHLYTQQRISVHSVHQAFSLLASGSDNENITNNNKNDSDSWSKAAPTDGRRSSPLKVRKRVRAVLEKARSRTGIGNGSSSTLSSDARRVQSVVAEAASIGGLGDGPADIVVQLATNGTNLPSAATAKAIDSNNGVAANAARNGYRNSPQASLTDEELTLQTSVVVDTNGSVKPASSSYSPAVTRTTTASSTSTPPPRKPKEFDVIRGDVPAAAEFCEPLPFRLPKLSQEQKVRLQNGDRLQEQSRMGREGSGYVILDVKAPPFVVWETLLDFESYPDIIPTVRSMQLYTSEKLNTGFVNEKPVLPGTGRETRHYGTPSVTRAAFTLSKFRLTIAAIHRYTPHPLGDYMIFTLDRSCTNMVLKGAKGIWYTEENPDG